MIRCVWTAITFCDDDRLPFVTLHPQQAGPRNEALELHFGTVEGLREFVNTLRGGLHAIELNMRVEDRDEP